MMKYFFLLTFLLLSLNSNAQSGHNTRLYVGIETFPALSGYEGVILVEQGHYLHLTGEFQIEDLSAFATIGPVCQLGFRSYSDFVYACISYSVNTTNQSLIEHGAMIEIGWYLDFGKRKEIRFSIGGGMGFHLPINKNVRINGDLSRTLFKPLGFRLSYDFSSVK